MTNREFFEKVIATTVDEEIKDFATSAIAKLDERNAKRNSQPSKKALENAPIIAEIVKFVGENANKTAPEIATAVGVSTQKASSLCVQLVKDGQFKSTAIKVKGKGEMKAYSLAD